MKRLVVDVANIFWRTVAAQQRYGSPDAKESAGFGLHMSLMSLRKQWYALKPDKMAIVFEGKANWRKEYTRSDACVSKRLYKGNRVADPSMAVLGDVIRAFEELARAHSNITCLSHPRLEGDDLIAGYAQHYAAEGDEVTVLSGDKDFVQLLGDKKIKLVNPEDGKERTLLDVCGVDDAGYFIFEKCFRGDAGDNVITAYPRVQAKKLKKAYGVDCQPDDFELANLMAHTWTLRDKDTGDDREMCTRDLFNENKLLMDLTAQPKDIRDLITETIVTEAEKTGSFNYFHFSRFVGQYELKQIGERSQDFVEMLSGRHPAAVERAKNGGAPPTALQNIIQKIENARGGFDL
jgi:5'-3' exonuclease